LERKNSSKLILERLLPYGLGNFLKIWESDEPDLISENEDEETDLI
jgi:hypothetical protein